VLVISSKTFFLYLKLLLLNYEGTGSWKWFNLQNARGQLKTDMGQVLMLRTVSNMNIPILTLFSSSSAWKGGEPHLVWILSHHKALFASPNSLLPVNSRLLYISFSLFFALLCFFFLFLFLIWMVWVLVFIIKLESKEILAYKLSYN